MQNFTSFPGNGNSLFDSGRLFFNFKWKLIVFILSGINFIFTIPVFSQTTTCSTATLLTAVNAATCTPGTTFDISGTGSGPSYTTCATSASSINSWGRFVANSGTASISYTPQSSRDAMIFAYSGTCPGSLTQIGCEDDYGNGVTETLNLTGLTAGTTYYIRIAAYNRTSGSMTGNICIASSYSIVTGSIAGSSFCAGNSVPVPFVNYGVYSSNTFTAQLSNSSGSFSSPVSIGTLVSNANSGTINANIPSGTVAGTGYRIRVISNNPAVTGSNNGANLTINGTPSITSSTTATTKCFSVGAQTSSLSYSAASNSPTNYTITWSAGALAAGLINVGSTTLPASPVTVPVAAGATAGTYTGTLTVSNSNGCGTTGSSFSLTINAAPTVTISPNYCIGGGVIRLTASIQNSYLWSTGAATQYINVNTAGTYTVTGTNASGCSAAATIDVAHELVTNGNFSAGNTSFTSSYNYTSASGGLYPEGYYSVGNDANYYHSYFFGKDHTSGIGNFMIVNGSALNDEIWGQTVTVTPNTKYYFSAWAMSLNDVPPYAQLRFSVNDVEVGTTAVLAAGANTTAGPFTWVNFYGTWNSGSNTTAVINIIDLQTAAGGNDVGLDDISFGTLSPVTMTIAPTANTPVCTGSTLNLTPNITGGNSPFTYAWTGPGGYTSAVQNPAIAGATISNAGIYALTVTDGFGCSASSSTSSVIMNALPTVSAGSSVCAGSTITLSPTTGGTWSSSNATRAAVTNAGVVTGVSAGSVSFTFAQASTGCSNTTSSVTVNASPAISAASSVCIGSTITLSPTTGGTWTSSNTAVATVTDAGVVTPVSAGSATFTFTQTSTGCSNTTSTVTVNSIPAVSAGASVCVAGTIAVSPATGGTWISSNTAKATVTNAGIITGVAAGTAAFTFTQTSTGCSNTTSSVTVNALPAGQAVSAPVLTICSGSSANIQIAASQSGVNYQLRNNATNVAVGSLVAGTGGLINLSTGVLNSAATFNVLATIAGSGCAVQMSATITINVNSTGQWIGGASGDWNTAGNWCGGVPVSSTNVAIPAGSTITIQSGNAVANSVTVASAGNLIMTGAYNLSITAGGTFTNNGTFNASSCTGAVSFLGNGTVSGTTTFKNIDAYGALDFGPSGTVSGTFSLQPGGSVTGYSPVYTCPASTLVYKTGNVCPRGLEWTPSSSGAGYPANVIVQNNTTINFPVVGNGYVCNDLQIDAGSSIRQNYSGGSAGLSVGRNITINGTLELGNSAGGDISLGGSWIRNTGGIFINNDRKVTFDGPSNFSGNGISMSTISAPASGLKNNEGGFGGENFAQVLINKTNATDSVVLLSNITVNREIGFTKGTFSLRNSDVTIVSNSTRTADVAAINTPANVSIRYGGTGRFITQRFIQNPTAVRSWRLITAPLQSAAAPSLNAAFMEGVVNPDKNNPNGSGGIYNPWPGYSTHITGPGGAYSAANGFDQGTNSSSILYASAGSSSWLTPSSTITAKVTDQQGWMLFVRGDRNFVIGSQYTPAQNTTLEPKGKINTGDISVPVIAGRQVIGNPYPSAISLLNVNVSGILGKLSVYHMWDPKMFTSYTQPGKWVSFSGLGSSFVHTTSASSYLSNGIVESGQAFLLDVIAPGNITFHESDKLGLTSSLTGIANRPMSDPVFPMFRTDIYAKSGSDYILTDGVLNVFNSVFSSAADDEDAKKFISFNTKESLSILKDSVKLAIEKRADIQENDTIFFAISKFNELPYQFRFEATDFYPGYEAFLEDNYTGSRTQVSTGGATAVNFDITADPFSKAADRFRIVFKSTFGNVLPVTFTGINVYRHNKTIKTVWKVENEISIARYEIERSKDGIHFTRKYTETNVRNDYARRTYDWTDEEPQYGLNYFRVKAVDINGREKYTGIAKVFFEKQPSAITAFPNPVNDGKIHLYFTAQQAGEYTARLYNTNGQVVQTDKFQQLDGNGNAVIVLDNNLIKGNYVLKIVKPDNTATSIKIVY